MRSLPDHRPDDPSQADPSTLAAADAASAQPRAVTPTPWTFRQMLIGALATLIPWIAFSIGSNALFGSTSTASKPPSAAVDAISGVVVFVVSGLLEAVFLIAPALVVTSRHVPHAPLRERLRWLGFRATPLAPAIALVVIGLAIALGASLLYSQLITSFHLPLQTNSDTLLKEGRVAPLTTLGILAAAALVAPICEEVFFRSFVFVGLLKRYPLWPSIVVSAIVFGVAHSDLGSLAPLIAIGLILAWVRWRTDSIWPGMAIHAANNAAAALFLLPYLIK